MSGWDVVAILNKLSDVSCRLKKVESCCSTSTQDITHIEEEIQNIYNIIGTEFTAYFMGSWVSDQTYLKNQYVSYDEKNYVALTDNTGIIPSGSSTDWKEIGSFNTIINCGTF